MELASLRLQSVDIGALDYGALGLLFVIIVGIGVGGRLFIKWFTERQDREDARNAQRDEFITKLAEGALTAQSERIAAWEKVASGLAELSRSHVAAVEANVRAQVEVTQLLQRIKETLDDHDERSGIRHEALLQSIIKK